VEMSNISIVSSYIFLKVNDRASDPAT
jgi:hypothetical protein